MAYSVSVSDYRDHRAVALGGLDLWENHGWMVWDRNGDDNILLWLSPYRLIGRRPGSPFVLDDVVLSQTLLVRTAYQGQERLTMHDNPFLAVGYDLGDHLPGEAMEVSVDERQAVWRVGNRHFIGTPPAWKVQGEHAGVDVDLQFQSMGSPFWFTDPAKSVQEIQERWFLLCARARGRVAYEGRVREIDGYASHERHVHCGTRYNPICLLAGRGVTWHSGGVDGIQVLICSRPSLGLAWAKLVLDERTCDFSAPAHTCTVLETDFWIDPQSRLQVPCAWQCRSAGPTGEMEVTSRAFARAYYLWPHFTHGCTVLYWWVADATLRYRLATGEHGHVNLPYIIHDNRVLYRRHRND